MGHAKCFLFELDLWRFQQFIFGDLVLDQVHDIIENARVWVEHGHPLLAQAIILYLQNIPHRKKNEPEFPTNDHHISTETQD